MEVTPKRRDRQIKLSNPHAFDRTYFNELLDAYSAKTGLPVDEVHEILTAVPEIGTKPIAYYRLMGGHVPYLHKALGIAERLADNPLAFMKRAWPDPSRR